MVLFIYLQSQFWMTIYTSNACKTPSNKIKVSKQFLKAVYIIKNRRKNKGAQWTTCIKILYWNVPVNDKKVVKRLSKWKKGSETSW